MPEAPLRADMLRRAENALGPYRDNYYRLPTGEAVHLVEVVARAIQDYGGEPGALKTSGAP